MKCDDDMSLDPDDEAQPSVKQLLAGFQKKIGNDSFRKPPLPIRRAPPPPPHRAESRLSNTDESIKSRRSPGPKPKVAPKPLHLLNSNSSPQIMSPTSSCQTPDILVSPVGDENDINFESYVTDSTINSQRSDNDVKSRAKALEDIGLVLRPDRFERRERPISEVSTISQASTEYDDGETSEDDSVTDGHSLNIHQLNRKKHEDDFDELPLPRHERKATYCANTHTEIMQEMEQMGFVRDSKLVKKQTRLTTRRGSNNDAEIPADVGKLRDTRKGRHNSLFVPSTSGISTSDSEFSRNLSGISDRSSTLTTGSSDQPEIIIPDYNTGDEEEDARLKKLHYAAVEFQKVQSNYVQYLTEMAVLYPTYMERFGKNIGKDLLAPKEGVENVVLQLKKILLQILPSHEMLLNEITTVISNWDSRHPNMSNVIYTYADFLKCCQPFLNKKSEFLTNLLALRNENKEFDEATYMFETEVFNRGKKGAVIQQLDQVHQNFMRYKLLMLRYLEYLEEGTEEHKKAQETVEKLEQITQAVNAKMGLPTTEELTKLYYRFQCQFNVLQPGRTLIRQGDVLKQTRKDQQPRYLVLFTDCLWICRVNSRSHFDLHRSYRIPVEGIRTNILDHEDYARCLFIRSKVKSVNLIFGNEKERDMWDQDIQKAILARKTYKRRQSEAIIKQTMNKKQLNKHLDEAKNQEVEDGSEGIEERPQAIGQSRSHSLSVSESDGFSSVPQTPIDDTDEPDLNAFLNGKMAEAGTSQGSRSLPKLPGGDVKPVWLPDKMSNACLMQGCSTEFNLINRRHHCRDCGWLICSDCTGKAPLSKYDYRKQNVCPECYERIHEKYISGYLFPQNRLSTNSDGTCMVRVGKRHESQSIEARKLFKPPYNFMLKKVDIDEKRAGLAFGKVYFRIRKGSEVVRYALLTNDLRLLFYKAELDCKPVFEVFVHGYKYRETDLDGKDGWLFQLVHRNQIKTDDTKDNVVAFRVDNNASAKRWSSAFERVLTLDDDAETSNRASV
ncbi:unnamed protein product [Caenorhabditis bovis]|uniref:Uncharacterized protein n=1 Tax=Caenorhabditis bovis TaxID=2654633 RepID=A0A8S1EZK7_9PELO|nr:unnamed protein product [Caenorhabditis bovis]